MRNTTVLVTGVTGTLGEKVAARFIKENAKVKGLIRSNAYIDRLEKLGIETVIADLSDIDTLAKAIGNVDIVIHCAAYLGDDIELANASNVTGVDNLAKAALAVGIKTFIHISSTSVYGEPADGFFDETTPRVHSHPEPYVQTKAASERILESYTNKGLNWVILRPGAICSEMNSHWGDKQVIRMAAAEEVDWVQPEDLVPWVHAENLVDMIALVIEKGVHHTIYNAIDGNFPEKDFRVKLCDAAGKILKIPDRQIERPVYSNQKIKDLGYIPRRSFESTVLNLEKLAKTLSKAK